MFSLENIIFDLFGVEDKQKDINKDGNNRGTFERYNRTLGEDYDDFIEPLIENFVSNTIDPVNAQEKFVPWIEAMLGNPARVKDDIATRRKMASIATRIYQVKGTKLSYDILFKLLGYDTITITEHIESFGFDSPFTFDDESRVFDSSCQPCTEYTISLDGLGVVLTDEITETIFKIIKFVQPIDTRLREVIVNGVQITFGLLEVQIIDGILYYDNSEDPGTTLELIDGILYVDGDSASFYQVIDGILYYVI